METERDFGVVTIQSANFEKNSMLAESVQWRCSNATEIKPIQGVVEALEVEQGGRENIRMIGGNGGKSAAPTYLNTATIRKGGVPHH